MKTSVGRKFDSLVAKTCVQRFTVINRESEIHVKSVVCRPFHLHSSALTQVFFSEKDAMEFQLDIFMHDRQLKALRFSSCTVVRY